MLSEIAQKLSKRYPRVRYIRTDLKIMERFVFVRPVTG
jgi:hypothetical protein